MNHVRRFNMTLGLCLLALLAIPCVASADNYTTTTPLQWNFGGTLTGSFQLDSSGNPINWNLTSTSTVSNGIAYTPGDDNGLVPIVTAGEEYTFSDQFASGFTDGSGNPLFNGGVLSITVDCQGVSNCLTQGTAGQFFTITGATEDFATWNCSNGPACQLSVAAPVTLDVLGTPAFINVSGDPTFGLDATSQGTAWTPNGGTATTPEPSSFLLIGLGLLGIYCLKFALGKRASQLGMPSQL